MSAIETAAALSNALSSLPSTSPPVTATAIAAALASLQAFRAPRATALVAASQQTQHRFAMETARLTFLNRLVYPGKGPGAALRLLSEAYPGAVRLDGLDVPGERPRMLPYWDELAREPQARDGWAAWGSWRGWSRWRRWGGVCCLAWGRRMGRLRW